MPPVETASLSSFLQNGKAVILPIHLFPQPGMVLSAELAEASLAKKLEIYLEVIASDALVGDDKTLCTCSTILFITEYFRNGYWHLKVISGLIKIKLPLLTKDRAVFSLPCIVSPSCHK